MSRSWLKAAVALAGALCAGPGAAAPAVAPPPGLAAAKTAPAWKQIYQNSQAVFYIDVSEARPTGQFAIASLVDYRIAQVIDGAQVWSVVAHMGLSCDQRQMVTIDNTLYALKMGTGPVVEAQTAGDVWHPPQPGSLGSLIWSTACGKP